MLSGGGIGAGARHVRSEWGRWWRAEDLTDTHIAHRILNDQYRMWRGIHQRAQAEVQQNIKLLKDQQRMQTYQQMQRMQMQRRGGYGGYGFGLGGASPMVTYRMMQWAQVQMRMGQDEFRHLEITPAMLQIGRGQARSRRHHAAAVWMLGLLVVWLGLWWLSAFAGLVVTAAAVVLYVGLAWIQGRHPTHRRPPVPKLLFVPSTVPEHTQLAEPDPEPFPLREAGRDPRRAREAVDLAFRRQTKVVVEVAVPEETAYGWTVPIVLKSGTSDQLVSVLRQLTTPLRVGENRIMARQTDPDDAARHALQILTSDPFEHPLPYPERPPGSCSIRAPFSIGMSIEGETTPIVLGGQHVIIVADTGGGKTAMTQCLAEYVTACHDAVAVDIDPVKRGLKALSPAAAMTARSPEEAEAALGSLLARAQARIASMPPTQDTWEPTADAPAIVVFLDEFPELTKRGKELAIRLLRTGREPMITVVIITQDATEDTLSDAIADVPGVRIMLPCRAADVPLVVGQRDAIGRGWLPHHLVPSPEEGFPADAGRFYAITPRHRVPILRYVSPLPSAEADRRARERVAAGLPRLESAAPARSVDVPEIVSLLLAAFAAESDPDVLTVGQIATHLAAADPRWRTWDARKDKLAMVGRTIKSELRAAGLDVPSVRHDALPGRPTAYRLTDIRKALL